MATAFRDAEREFLEEGLRRCAEVSQQPVCAALIKEFCAEASYLRKSRFAAAQPYAKGRASGRRGGKRAQADTEQRKQEEDARYLSCTLLPAPDDARGLAAFLASARPDPALCEPAAVLASCQAPHPS